MTIREGTTVLGTGTATAAGTFSIDVSLTPGAHTLTAVATDAAANASPASATLSVTVDNTAPTAPGALSLAAADDTGASSSDGITNVTTGLTITGTAEAGSVVTVRDGSTVLGTTTATAGGTYSVDVSLAAGAHSLTAIATDVAGNVSAASAALAITVDTTAPASLSAPVLAAADDSGASSTDGVTSATSGLTLSGTAEAGSTVTVKDGTTAIGTTTATAGGTYTIDVSLAAGAHSLTATATDLAGNVSAASPALAVTVDTAAPSAPTTLALAAADDLGSSSSDGITSATSGLTITGNAEAGSTVVVKDGATVVGSTTASAGGTFSLDVSLAAGAHSLTATATDAAGNVGVASSALAVTVDTTAPTVTISSNPASLLGAQTGTLTFTFSEAPVGFAAGDIAVTGATVTNLTATADPKVYTATLTPTASVLGNLTVSVAGGTFTDAAGNASASGTLNVAFDPGTSGAAIDGYIANALVFRDANSDGVWDHESFTDANNNGVFDAGEAFVDADSNGAFTAEYSAVTDAQGNFSGLYGSGRIVLVPLIAGNGTNLTTDISTGKAFTGQFTAANGSTVVTPLTTLVESIAGAGASAAVIAAAETQVKAALGISASVDLASFDPLAIAATSSDPAAQADALAVQKAGIQVANILTVIAAVTEAAGAGAQAGIDSAVSTLATQISAGAPVDLSSTTLIATVVQTAAADVGGNAAILAQADAVGTSLGNVNTLVQDATGATAADAFGAIVTAQIVAQDTLASEVATAVENNTVVDSGSYEGTALTDKVDDASTQVQTVLPPATPTPPSALAAPDRPTIDDGARISVAEAADGAQVTVGIGNASGLAAGDALKLFVGGTEVASAIIGAGDLSAGAVTFALTQSQLGADGAKTITAQFVSSGGLAGAVSFPLITALDTAGPNAPTAFGIDQGDDTGVLGDLVTSLQNAITVTGSAEANSSVVIREGGTILGSGIADGTGAFRIDVNLTEGGHTLSAQATDAAGNAGAVGGFGVTVDGTPPAVPANLALSAADDTGVSNSDRLTSQTSGLTITGTGDVGSRITLFSAGNVLGTGIVDATGNFAIDVALAANATSSVTATATDPAGNTSVASAALDITVDTAGATVPTGFSLSDGGIVTAIEAANGMVIGGATVAGTTVSVTLTGSLGSLTKGAQISGTAFSLALTQGEIAQLGNGTVNFTATATDAAGNAGAASASGQFYYQANPVVDTNARVDSAAYPFVGEDDEEGGATVDMTPLPGGGFATHWIYDSNDDGDGDGVAIQKFSADGSKVGGVVTLALDRSLLEFDYFGSEEPDLSYEVTALDNGGFAFSYSLGMTEHFIQATLSQGVAQVLLIGEPSELYLMSPLPAGASLSLRGTDASGQLVTVPVTFENGQTVVDPASLATIVSRVALVATGLTGGATVMIGAELFAPAVFDPDSSFVPIVRTATATGTSLSFNYPARTEVFHLDSSSVTPTNAVMTISLESGGNPSLISGIPNATLLSNGQIRITNLQPNGSGNYVVPQQILNAIGGEDFHASLTLNGMTVGSTATMTLSTRAPIAVPEGVFVQTFDANGNLVTSITDRIDPAGQVVVNESDRGTVSVSKLAGGGFAVKWIVDDNNDGDGDTLAVQRFAADGTKVGEVVELVGIDPVLLNSPNEDLLHDLRPLSGGGYEVALGLVRNEWSREYTISSNGQPIGVPVIGLLDEFYVNAPSGATVSLTGTGLDGAPFSLAVTPDFGFVNVTPEMLANFLYPNRVTVSIANVPAGQTAGVLVEILQDQHYDSASAPHDVQVSGTVLANGIGVFTAVGRADSLHIDSASGTPTSVNLLVRPTLGTNAIDFSQLPPVNQQPNGTFTFANITADANGVYHVPEAFMAQYADYDVQFIWLANGLTPGSSATGTLSVHDPIANPEGVYVQQFGADGVALSASAVKIDGPNAPLVHESEDNGLVGITPTSDGGSVVHWVVDLNDDGDGDTIAIQRLDASGSKVGGIVLLDGLDPKIAENEADDLPFGFEALDNGGYALTYGVERPEAYRNVVLSNTSGAPFLSTNMVGTPQYIYGTSNLTYRLSGVSTGGVSLVTTLTADAGGHAHVPDSVLAQYRFPDRLQLQIGGIPLGQTASVFVALEEFQHADLSATLHDFGVSGTLTSSVLTMAQGDGRNEAFRVQFSAGAPTAANMSIMLPNGASGIDISSVAGAAVRPDGTIVISNLTVSADGYYRIPDALLEQIGDSDAGVFVTLLGLTVGATYTGNIQVRDTVPNPEGLFVQTFDAAGHAVSANIHVDGWTLGTPVADTLTGTSGDDQIDAAAGNDTINATSGTDFVDGGSGGGDRLVAMMGDSTRFAAPTGSRVITIGPDSISDSSGAINTTFTGIERVTLNTLGGTTFGDTVDASGFVSSHANPLSIILSGGNNAVIGSSGNDLITTGFGDHQIDGGAGSDTGASYTPADGTRTVFVTSSNGQVVTTSNGIVHTFTNVERVDVLGSGTGAITIDASGYQPLAGVSMNMVGHNGTDIMIGSSGADAFGNLAGTELGQDKYTGNGGADIFDFTYAADSMNGDTIMDLDADDVIDFRFNNLEAGGSPVKVNAFIGNGAFTGVAGQYRYQASGGKTVIQADTNGDMVADLTLNIANGQFALSETAAGSNVLKIIGKSGTSGNDTIVGTLGNDGIYGQAGNDNIGVTQGTDYVDGGAGTDRLTINISDATRFTAPTSARTYILTANSLTESGGALNTSFTSIERFTFTAGAASTFNDTLDARGMATIAATGALFATMGSGDDTVYGSNNADLFNLGLGTNWVDAGAGSDEVRVNYDNTTGETMSVSYVDGVFTTSVLGAVNNTVMNAETLSLIGFTFGASITSIDASAVSGYNGRVIFYDNDGSNIDIGSTGMDIFSNVAGGYAGNDTYTGNGGADIFDYTFAVEAMDNDTITDLDADDIIDLSYNDPQLNSAGTLADKFIGNAAFSNVAGQYRYEANGGKTYVQVDWTGDGVTDETLTIANGQFALGETAPGSDKLHIIGMSGTSGDDNLAGGSGSDTIFGQGGADVIDGGAGPDVLTGGAGADMFVLESPSGQTLSLADLITDFQAGSDHLDLPGTLTFAELTIAQGNPGTNGAVATETLVIETASGDILARLAATDAAQITQASFV